MTTYSIRKLASFCKAQNRPPEAACACRGRAIAEPAKVDPCATCGGRGEVGGFEGGGAPGYVTEPCPDCRPKVDPYATHRLAGERRRAELMKTRPHWAARLAEATERLAVIDRELDRLDRTGEVE